jgi:hypothetical protein
MTNQKKKPASSGVFKALKPHHVDECPFVDAEPEVIPLGRRRGGRRDAGGAVGEAGGRRRDGCGLRRSSGCGPTRARERCGGKRTTVSRGRFSSARRGTYCCKSSRRMTHGVYQMGELHALS